MSYAYFREKIGDVDASTYAPPPPPRPNFTALTWQQGPQVQLGGPRSYDAFLKEVQSYAEKPQVRAAAMAAPVQPAVDAEAEHLRAALAAQRQAAIHQLQQDLQSANRLESAALARFERFAPGGFMASGSVVHTPGAALPRMAEKARASAAANVSNAWACNVVPSTPSRTEQSVEPTSPTSPASMEIAAVSSPPMPTGAPRPAALTPEKQMASPPKRIGSPFGAGSNKKAPPPPPPQPEKKSPPKSRPRLSPSVVKGSMGIDPDIASKLERPRTGQFEKPIKPKDPLAMNFVREHHLRRDPVRVARPNAYSYQRD